MGEQSSALGGLVFAAVMIAALAYGLGDGGALLTLTVSTLGQAGTAAAAFVHAVLAYFAGGH